MTQPYPPATPPTPPGPPMPIGHLSYPPRRSGLLRGFLLGCVALAALVIAFALGVGVGASTPATPPTAASEVPASAPAVSFPAEPAPVTATAPAATVVPAPAPSADAYPPAAAFDNGAWKVGDEVTAGTYRSAGPTDGVVKLCYVDTKVDDKIVSQEVSNAGPVRITVADGQTVKASGCQQFVKVG
jgi:hypothetical protein